MIDFKTKTFYFGHGDILINTFGFALVFRGINPPQEVGTEITEDVIKNNNIEWLTDKFYLDFRDIQEVVAFENSIKQIANTNGQEYTQFKFKDFTLDFTIYNEKTISMLLLYLATIRNNLLLATAC